MYATALENLRERSLERKSDFYLSKFMDGGQLNISNHARLNKNILLTSYIEFFILGVS